MKILLTIAFALSNSVGYAEAALRDVPVCEALKRLSEYNGKEVQLVGELQGSFYHGFGLFGRADLQPCVMDMSWLRSPASVGVILVDFATRKGAVLPVFTQFEDVLKNHGLWVRVSGQLRTKAFYFKFCFSKANCVTNGFLGESPAIIAPRLIEILDPPAVKQKRP